MSFRVIAAAASLLLVASAASASTTPPVVAVVEAETPRSLAAIPLFPGLQPLGVRDFPDEEGTILGDVRGNLYPRLEGKEHTWVTTAPVEEVYAFYLERLGGKVEYTYEDDHVHIGPGGVTPVIRNRYPHELRPTENTRTNRAISPATQRQLLSSNRPASSEGDWLHSAMFSWVTRDRSGARTAFHIEILDDSVAHNWEGYAPRTVVTIAIETYGQISDDDD